MGCHRGRRSHYKDTCNILNCIIFLDIFHNFFFKFRNNFESKKLLYKEYLETTLWIYVWKLIYSNEFLTLTMCTFGSTSHIGRIDLINPMASRKFPQDFYGNSISFGAQFEESKLSNTTLLYHIRIRIVVFSIKL